VVRSPQPGQETPRKHTKSLGDLLRTKRSGGDATKEKKLALPVAGAT
jgi:hypothetical protein